MSYIEWRVRKSMVSLRSAAAILDEMRVFKDPLEVERLQKACNITARALTRVMKECKPGRMNSRWNL